MATDGYRRLLDQCIHCGLCLPACPTYHVLQQETDSPRGRIQLMDAVASGRIDPDGAFRTHIDLCLGCRACEPACPSGVQYGALLERARSVLADSPDGQKPSGARRLRAAALGQLLPYRRRLRALAGLLRIYQRSGLQTMARRSRLLGTRLRAIEELLPRIPDRYPAYDQPAPAVGERRGAVVFLYGCVQDAFLSGVNEATVRVLQANGYDVHFPAGQTCCGAAPLHTGEAEIARMLARRNLDAFDPTRFAAVINNAGGCGATLKEYHHLLADEPHYAEKARQFVAKVQDVSEFLAANLHVPPTGYLDLQVTYADSCHLRNAQRVVEQPRTLLRRIPGVELVEQSRPDFCCGSAGVYNLLQTETAEAVLHAKMEDIARTGADVLVTTNTGCHMQYLHGVRQAGLNMRVMHLVELLDDSYARGA